jgi:hypothetical protein
MTKYDFMHRLYLATFATKFGKIMDIAAKIVFLDQIKKWRGCFTINIFNNPASIGVSRREVLAQYFSTMYNKAETGE